MGRLSNSGELVLGIAMLTCATAIAFAYSGGSEWNEQERAVLQSLSLDALDPLPDDPGNRVANDTAAARFGRKLFFDARLSINGQVSCGTCHVPERQFQDDRALGEGVGRTPRRTMTIAGTAHSPWHFWDGRKDSQWSQALGPLESAVEHGGSRALYVHVIAQYYREEYQRIFGALPGLADVPRHAGPVDDPAARQAWEALGAEQQDAINRAFANIGKAIAAYERTLEFEPSRFDRYVAALAATGRAPTGLLTNDEIAGLRLFIGRANCTQCHNGPLLTDNHFHNTGVPARPGLPHDDGRATGVRLALADEFNCRGRYSDAPPASCTELEFAVTEGAELERAFRTPSLRGAADRAPFMHAGQIQTVHAVVDHYNRAPTAPSGHSEIQPLKLSAKQRTQLVSFLRTLTSEIREAH